MKSKLSVAFSSVLFLRGGCEQRLVNIMRTLHRRGHRINLVAGHEVDWFELPQTNLSSSGTPLLGSIINFLSFFRFFVSKKNAYDVFVINGYIETLASILARKLSGGRARIVKISYGPEPGHTVGVESGFKHRIIRYVYRNSDAVVCTSKWSVDYVRRVFDTEPVLIYTGIDSERFSPKVRGNAVRKKLGVDKADIMVLFVGHLLERKGIFDLLNAIPKVIEGKKDVKFVFVGNSWNRENRLRAERFITKNRLKGSVIFTGEIDNRKLPEYYAACDIFCLPSWEESQPLVCLEAMSSRKAVVAADISGTPEIVLHGKTGLLVEPRNPSKLAKAILRMSKDKRLRERYALAGFRKIHADHTIGIEADRFMRMFRGLISAS
jgi:glycosyltransferase involved in cell wall biosynthesis